MIVLPQLEVPVVANVFDESETWGDHYRRLLIKDRRVLAIMFSTTTETDYLEILRERGETYVRRYTDDASSLVTGARSGWIDELHITELALRSVAGCSIYQTAQENGVTIVQIPLDLSAGLVGVDS